MYYTAFPCNGFSFINQLKQLFSLGWPPEVSVFRGIRGIDISWLEPETVFAAFLFRGIWILATKLRKFSFREFLLQWSLSRIITLLYCTQGEIAKILQKGVEVFLGHFLILIKLPRGLCFSKICNLIPFSTIRHGRVITIPIYFINPFYAR